MVYVSITSCHSQSKRNNLFEAFKCNFYTEANNFFKNHFPFTKTFDTEQKYQS